MDQEEEIIIGNRRLRKVKRPRQYTGPIGENGQPLPPVESQIQSYQPRNYDASNADEYASSYVQEYVQGEGNTYENALSQPDELRAFDSIKKKNAFVIAIGCVILGLLIGKFVFGAPKIVQQGLQGVVLNPEVPKGRSRCGMVEKTQGCVLYVMNPQRQDLNGRDFYDWASQQTGRQRFVIETGNMRYSNARIRPGGIAQLNIPPLQ